MCLIEVVLCYFAADTVVEFKVAGNNVAMI